MQLMLLLWSTTEAKQSYFNENNEAIVCLEVFGKVEFWANIGFGCMLV
jgi:hypothetical protein